MDAIAISDREFAQVRDLLYDVTGIALSDAKKTLVSSRLGRQVLRCGLSSFEDYYRLIASGESPGETQAAIDLLTTNETYFFREPRHFEWLRKLAMTKGRAEPFRVWSAASATGEEAYSIAMVLADCLGDQPWEIVGTDISLRAIDRARAAHYAVVRTERIPQDYRRRFCLRGIDIQEGTFLIVPELRRRVRFAQINLNATLPELGSFDVIFLRNILIYFDADTKRQVLARALGKLKTEGHLLIGHSESLNGLSTAVKPVTTSIYRKVGRHA